MAVFQTTRISSSLPDRANIGNNTIVEQFTVSSNLTTNDTIEFCFVPKNAIITNFLLGNSANVGTTSNVTVGDAADPDRFLTTTALTGAVVGRINNAAGLGFRYSARTKLFLTAASIATPATGSVITFILDYRMDY
jgi:hypothetical protein